MLAIGNLFVSADGGVVVWELRAWCSRGWLCPLHFGNIRTPAEVVGRVQTIWTSLEMIVGFVKIQFDLYTRISMIGGASNPISAVLSMRGRLQRQTRV